MLEYRIDRPRFRWKIDNILAENTALTLGRLLEACQQAQQGGFATA